jgi:menaquinone-dependent protoporphyrinogen IX oxidase
VSARVLVTYAASSGCDSTCAIDIADEIAGVPDLEVDIKPLGGVATIEPYVAVYLGWVQPSNAATRELERFLNANAALLPGRPVWVVDRHPRCAGAGPGPTKMTRLVFTAPS